MITVGDRFRRVANHDIVHTVLYGPFDCFDGERTVPTVQCKNQNDTILEMSVEGLESDLYERLDNATA